MFHMTSHESVIEEQNDWLYTWDNEATLRYFVYMYNTNNSNALGSSSLYTLD